MRIGVIYTAFNTVEYLRPSLQSWIEARRDQLDGHTFLICAVNCAFEGFENPPTDDGTAMILTADSCAGWIDRVITSTEPVKEIDARGKALNWLVENGCDALWMVDGDEFYTEHDISAILRFVIARPHTGMFRIALKNQVFTPSQYLVEPFTPPRIHRVNVGGYRAHSFWADNNVLYGGRITRDLIRDTDLPSVTVPQSLAWIRHASWLNNGRSKAKIDYQAKRWGAGTCTFAWDDARGGLIFNPALPAPEIAREGEGES